MNVADELEKLHKLHRDGVLSAEEFAAQKARVLAGGARAEDPGSVARSAKARKLVNASHALGWGGIGVLFVVGPIMIGVAGVAAGVFFMVLGLASAITGAVLGQVGRAMQGRVM